jgi:SAM-dependent methyltransferase
MIERARHNLTALSSETRNRIRLGRADIRTARLPRQFDVVVSLFHVMSYLPENNDLVAAFKTAATHLVPGGLFIFDCWYGPAVLAERPSLRVKRIENHNTKIVRIAEPEIRPNLNIVKVHYQVWVKDRHTKSLHEIRETHTMRYWFKPEVSEALTQTGFELRTFNEFMTAKEPGLDTWNVIFVARC